MSERAWLERLEPERREAYAWIDESSQSAGVRLADHARTAFVGWLIDRLGVCVRPVWEVGGDLTDYPAGAQLLRGSITAWRRRTSDLFGHLVRDAGELGVDTAIERVRTHGEGLHARATTLGLELGGNHHWFHRTRDRSMGAWFLDACASLNARGLSTPLHLRRLLVRDGCSWDEAVPILPCHEPPAIHRFFVRAGMLVRLLERFAAVDFHARNVVGSGEYPVLVDVETLFVPDLEGASAAYNALVRSPLRSGLLGLNVVGLPGRQAINGGGLHPGGIVHLPFDEDGQPLVEEVPPTIPAPLGDHVVALLAGWDEMEECLARTDISPLLARAGQVLRRDLRANGRIYHDALAGSLKPDLLRSVAVRDSWLGQQDFTAAELASLRVLELPRPMTRVGDHRALAALSPFTVAERARRHDLIRTVIGLREDHPPRPERRALPDSHEAIAVELGDRFLALRFAGSQWHGARWFPAYGAQLLSVLGGDLHGGNAGIAVVFAMLARVSGAARFAVASRAALATVPDEQANLGAMGLGGAIYALARCSELLRDDSLLARAKTYVAAAPRIGAPWDLLTGVAGFALGALATGAVPASVVDRLRFAWDLRAEPGQLLTGGIPPGLPPHFTGIAVALVRCGRSAAIPDDAGAWRILPGASSTPAIESRELLAMDDLLTALDLALALNHAGRSDLTGSLREIVRCMVERRRATGHWIPTTSIAERHQTSIVNGIPAVIHALLVSENPDLFSIRRME